jgi:hypothetical protein
MQIAAFWRPGFEKPIGEIDNQAPHVSIYKELPASGD